ncbi:cupin domain-containing protein [Flavobacterium sp. W21_SRS_FM6]|uniref:cupin domain-containing protein n=1 Tax=Flavobacterium sp. W21_SRS_FM6 TaxID=3240268 RepID=UPI003F8E60DE
MKHLLTVILCLSSLSTLAQNNEYNISSLQQKGSRAPNTHYIGDAWLRSIVEAKEDNGFNVTKATFKANSTLDWHKHSAPQVLIYLDGEGYYQERGQAPIILKSGDVIKCEADKEHWHSSTKYRDVTYLAIYSNSTPTVWTEVLSQEYYDNVATMLSQ